MNFEDLLNEQIDRRFDEIEMPRAVFQLPREALRCFFYERGWLILVRRKNRSFLRVLPARPAELDPKNQ